MCVVFTMYAFSNVYAIKLYFEASYSIRLVAPLNHFKHKLWDTTQITQMLNMLYGMKIMRTEKVLNITVGCAYKIATSFVYIQQTCFLSSLLKGYLYRQKFWNTRTYPFFRTFFVRCYQWMRCLCVGLVEYFDTYHHALVLCSIIRL